MSLNECSGSMCLCEASCRLHGCGMVVECNSSYSGVAAQIQLLRKRQCKGGWCRITWQPLHEVVRHGKANADLLGDADTSVTSSETNAVDCGVLSQEVPNLRSLACDAKDGFCDHLHPTGKVRQLDIRRRRYQLPAWTTMLIAGCTQTPVCTT